MKLKRIFAVICAMLMMLTLLGACVVTEDPDPEKDPPDQSIEDPKDKDDGKEDGDDDGDHKEDPPEVKPDKPTPDWPLDSGEVQSVDWAKGTVPTYDETRAEAYSYTPVVDTMPVVRINTADGKNDFVTKPDRDMKLRDEIEYVDATISIDGCDDAYVLSDLKAKVKARGNYTLNYIKKPIRIKLDKKNSFLGLNDGQKFKNWVLLADWKDLSMTNNALAFYYGNTILASDGFYSSDFRNVEVYINEQYWGVYLLVEQQEAKDGRMSVPEVPELENEAGEEVGYTGWDVGYLMEYDGYYTDERNMPNGAGDPTFELNYDDHSDLKFFDGGTCGTWGTQRGYTVKSDIYDDAQLRFLNSYMENVYKIIYEAAYKDRLYKFNDDYTKLVSATGTPQEIISAVLDVQSLVDTYILNEIACDPDIAWSSFYLGVDMSEGGARKLIFEAPWDFDSAFGIKAGFANNGSGLYAANKDNPWLLLLIHEDWFQKLVAEKWEELKLYGVLKNSLDLVTDMKTDYQSYYEKNYERWDQRIWGGDGELIGELNSYRTQAQAADYLYRWLYTRYNYLNTVWGDGKDVLTGESTGGSSSGPTVAEEPEAGAVAYRFEAEDCELQGGITVDERSEVSGGKHIGHVDNGKTITLTVKSDKAASAYLYVALSKRTSSVLFTDWFSVTVNGSPLTIPLRPISAIGHGEEEWFAWVRVKVAPMQLKAGTNTIVFTVVASDWATNVDYFELWSTAKLS